MLARWLLQVPGIVVYSTRMGGFGSAALSLLYSDPVGSNARLMGGECTKKRDVVVNFDACRIAEWVFLVPGSRAGARNRSHAADCGRFHGRNDTA